MKTLSALFLLLLIAFSSVSAADKDAPKDADKTEKAAATTAAPETADSLWEQIDTQRKALGDAVTANKKEDVHHTGDALAKLLKSVPEKFPDLSGLKRKSVHHQAKAAARLCGDLEEAVDEAKADQTNLILGQIDGAIKFIKGEVAKK